MAALQLQDYGLPGVQAGAAAHPAEKRRTGGVFAHSRHDAWLVGLAIVHFILLIVGVATVGRVGWLTSLALGVLLVFLHCTNYQCVAHNFLHNPFFRDKRLNKAFGVFNSLLLGSPQSLYRLQHLHHHKYNNDAPDPITGQVADFTSTWKHSRRKDREENPWTYSLLNYLRSDFAYLFRELRKRRLEQTAALEFAALVTMLAVFAWLHPLALFLFYLPVWFLGNVAGSAENYAEHHGAVPGDRRTDSVSSYGALYNLIWFNNGYHQEHHFRPQVHWTKIREIRALLPPENQRRVVPVAHWFNFGASSRLPAEALPSAPSSETDSAGGERS